NQYGGYNQNQPQQYNQYGDYNQNQPPKNNAYGFYGQNNNYQNNGYGNYNSPTGYNNHGVPDGYQSFNNSTDPPGAEQVYINERKGFTAAKVATIVFVAFFVGLAAYTVFCNDPAINAVLVEKIIPIGALLFVSAFSLYLALQPTINTIRKKPRCTQSVIAKIVDVKSRRSNNGGRTYFPTYKYSYRGKIYIIAAAKNMSLTPPYVGKELEMFINPDNPEEYYIGTKVINIISLVAGGFFFITALQFLIPTIFS
ncbi:MAG: DUF3592 domain-containing protein, partial [Acutalibacteraceae bacterium]|nr:DUF3592 domain-containing protein [Acutalibacteraceae bacterium]